MSGELSPGEPDFFDRRLGLARLREALEQLSDRLTRLERAGEAVDAAPRSEPQAFSVVQDILSIPSSGLPAELFALAMDRVSRLLAADRAMLFVPEPGGHRLVPRSAQGFRREDIDSIRLAAGEGLVGRVFSERRVLTFTAGGEGEQGDGFLERFPVQQAIAVPVRAEDGASGVLFAGRRRLGAPFSANDVLLLLVIADRVGVGLVHQQLLDRQARHVARLGALSEIAAELAAEPTAAAMLARAVDAAGRLLGVGAAAVALAAGPGDVAIAAARGLADGAKGRLLSTREGLGREARAGGGPAACRDLRSLAGELGALSDSGLRGCLFLPLTVAGDTTGLLCVGDADPRDFSADEIEAARVLAALVASGLEHHRAVGALGGELRAARADRDREIDAEKTRAVNDMAAGMVRELNGIFATVVGKSRLLLARAHDEPSREDLGRVEEAAWRGADIVQRLNALAPPASGGAHGPVDLATVVRDVLGTTQAAWKDEPEARGVRIELITDLGAGGLVTGSAPALREAVLSLVSNALDAMPGGGRLGLTLRRADGGVELVVEDTGEGIAPGAPVFDPFFTTRSSTHLGLGLTVARGAIARQGGRIELTSAPGQGTRAMVWLPGAVMPEPPADAAPAEEAARTLDAEPVVEGSPDAAVAPPPAADGQAPGDEAERALLGAPRGAEATVHRGESDAPRGPASILVLEDEVSARSILVEALTQAGHRVETAADEAGGLAMLEALRFDVVLTDLALPQGSGLAIARAVKRLQADTPVVLITGWGHLLDPERLREHGVDLMLVKPFRLERVLSVVGDALRLRSSA